MQLQTASRKKVKIKMSISSPTGFGKTTSALLIAYGLCGDWTKIAVIDTENRSASLYSHLGPFQVIEIEPPFTIDKFCKAVQICKDAGIEVCIPDSIYHYWHGSGGVLDYVGSLGGRYQDWAKGSPMWQRLLNSILQTDMHFISTARKKQAYELIKKGDRTVVEKKGLEDQVRDGFDYEMTIAFEIVSDNHLARSSKDRTSLFSGKDEFVITSRTGELIREWCNLGVDAPKLKPILGEVAFTTALSRIQAGESTLFTKVAEMYTITDEQMEEFSKHTDTSPLK